MQYHFNNIKTIDEQLLGENPTIIDILAKGVFGGVSVGGVNKDNTCENINSERVLAMDIRANVQAVIFNLHSLIDVMAHVIYYALGMNNSETNLSEHLISAKKVKDSLGIKHPEITVFFRHLVRP